MSSLLVSSLPRSFSNANRPQILVLSALLLFHTCLAFQPFAIDVRPGIYTATWSPASSSNEISSGVVRKLCVRTIRSDVNTVEWIQGYSGEVKTVRGGMKHDGSMDNVWTELVLGALQHDFTTTFKVYSRSTLEFSAYPTTFVDEHQTRYHAIPSGQKSDFAFYTTPSAPVPIPSGPHKVNFASDYPFRVRRKGGWGTVLDGDNGNAIPFEWTELQPKEHEHGFYFDFEGPVDTAEPMGKLEFLWNAPTDVWADDGTQIWGRRRRQ